MIPKGSQRPEVQQKIRETMLLKKANGHTMFFSEKPKPIDAEKEKKIMQRVRYE